MPNYSKEIEDDLTWREAELASMKLEIVRATPNTVKHEALLRAIWALLYAHYEGFCKYVWNIYLDALQKSGRPRRDFCDKIATLSLEGEFSKLRGDTSPEHLWSFGSIDFQRLLDENLEFPTKIETSNLWPRELRKLCNTIDLPCNLIDEHERKIAALVSRRNDIAHGQKMVIKDLKEYEEYEKATLLVMQEQAIAVVEQLETQSYLK